ncbi:hypothetical protein BSKO_11971 [Bryopsis sp. KO-2023]|nr:hypothetical protein BSKO_11971 [Bryopsis sp. KO-2023]
MVPGRYGDERGRQNDFLRICSPDVSGNLCVTPESAPYEEHPKRSMVKSVQAQENYHWMAYQQEQLEELDDMFRKYKHRCGKGRKSTADEPGLSSRIDTRLSLTSFDEIDENLEAPLSQNHHHRQNSTPRLPSATSTKPALHKKDLENSPFSSGRIYSPVEDENDDDVLKEALVAAQNVMEDKNSAMEVMLMNRPSSGASGMSGWSEDVRNSARSVKSYRDEYGGYVRSEWADEWEFGGDTARSARATLVGGERRHVYHKSEMASRGSDAYKHHHREDVLLCSNPLELELYSRSGKKRQDIAEAAMSTPMKPRGPRKPESRSERRTTRRYSSSVYTTSTPPETPKKKGGPGVPVTTAVRTPVRSSSMVGRMGVPSRKGEVSTPKRTPALRETTQSTSRRGGVGSQPYGPPQRLVSKTASFDKKPASKTPGKYGPPQRHSSKYDTGMTGVPYTRQSRGSASRYGPPQRFREGNPVMGAGARDETASLKPRSGLSQHRVALGSAGVKVRQQAGYSHLRT